MTARSHVRWSIVLAVFAAMAMAAATLPASGAAPAPSSAVGVQPPTEETVLLEVEDPDRLVRDLEALAAAWADGGGTFGYPFWEKAGQRWLDGQLTTTMYREYVTGYRDRLEAGCELLDAVDAGTEASREVRSLVLDSCRGRVEALQAQQRWLDAEVDQAAVPRPDADELESIRAAVAEHQDEYGTKLQASLRDARIAMELAQGALVQEGRERLPEDAFI